jgi:hypothetical protein
MKKPLFFILLTGSCIYGGWEFYQTHFKKLPSTVIPQTIVYQKTPEVVMDNELAKMLRQQAPTMQADVINKTVRSMDCANQGNIAHQSILTVIDYSLPSSEKRLWVFDLQTQKLLYHTFVAHGIKSGANYTTFYSNKNNSKSSSIGVYLTKIGYIGREGTSLKLQGLDRGLNDNAEGRSIVMHGAFYAEEAFIKKYGRAGRSWGCPALPASLSKSIIDTIKNDNLMVVYYPSEQWVKHSRFLNCPAALPMPDNGVSLKNPELSEPPRDEVFFVSSAPIKYATETTPVLAVSADYYMTRFKQPAPVDRMLRRRINEMEYIALNTNEIYQLAQHYDQNDLAQLNFVLAIISSSHGYPQTVMKPVNYGKITGINLSQGLRFHLENRADVVLQPNNRFVRWIGL